MLSSNFFRWAVISWTQVFVSRFHNRTLLSWPINNLWLIIIIIVFWTTNIRPRKENLKLILQKKTISHTIFLHLRTKRTTDSDCGTSKQLWPDLFLKIVFFPLVSSLILCDYRYGLFEELYITGCNRMSKTNPSLSMKKVSVLFINLMYKENNWLLLPNN